MFPVSAEEKPGLTRIAKGISCQPVIRCIHDGDRCIHDGDRCICTVIAVYTTVIAVYTTVIAVYATVIRYMRRVNLYHTHER